MGVSWNSCGIYYQINSILTINNNIIVATNGDGIFLSNDNGKNWVSINNGLSTNYIQSMSSNSNYIFVGTKINGVFRAKLSDFGITSVNDNINSTSNISLFPNPAQSLITINFNELTTSNINLQIYNTCGQKILENDVPIGVNSYQVDVQSLQTGMYYCVFDYGVNRFTKSFVVVK